MIYIWKLFGVVISIVMLISGAYLFFLMSDFRKNAILTTGIVIQLESIAVKKQAFQYYPIVEFQFSETEKVTFKPSEFFKAGVHKIGDSIQVLYLKNDKKSAKLTDFSSLWGTAIFLIIGGLLGVLMSIINSKR